MYWEKVEKKLALVGNSDLIEKCRVGVLINWFLGIIYGVETGSVLSWRGVIIAVGWRCVRVAAGGSQ